jgi:hypothetical protein
MAIISASFTETSLIAIVPLRECSIPTLIVSPEAASAVDDWAASEAAAAVEDVLASDEELLPHPLNNADNAIDILKPSANHFFFIISSIPASCKMNLPNAEAKISLEIFYGLNFNLCTCHLFFSA